MLGHVTLQQQLESGLSHHKAGRFVEAERFYRQVLAQQPDHADALHMLGALAAHVGRLDVGIELMRRAIRIKPDCADALYNLGNALKDKGQLDDTISAYRQAIRFKPDHVDAYNNLGIALRTKGQLDEAIAAYRQAIRLRPDFAEAHSNLGKALKDGGQLDEAIASYRQAIQLKPEFPGAYSNLGNALKDNGQLDEAIDAFRQAIRLKPDYAEAYSNLGNALRDMGRPNEAAHADRHAIRFKPDLAEAHCNLGNALTDLRQLDEAIAAYRQAIRLRPDDAGMHSSLLFALNYHPDIDPQSILAEHRAWSDRHAHCVAREIIPYANDRSPNRRLRIGYLSGDFRRHSVGYFLVPLLEHYDRRTLEIFCYSNLQRCDGLTERMKRSCDVWRDAFGLADEAVAKLVRSDGIDILVDLSGHTAGNRLCVLARKPAPIQVTYLGYANTTGMTAIDYRLTDALTDPAGMTDELNVEKLWRLPTCAWCYHPMEETPDIHPRGNGPITFGCFNAFAKINTKMVEMWAQLLDRVPGSRLLLKSAGAGEDSSRQRLAGQFAELGIAGDRIEIRGIIADSRKHLQLYGQVDVALDTYPYEGTTTTCEALWMGVPVVSLAGRTHVSRVGVSLLSNAGLPELIAQTPEQYLQIAADLAIDPSRLAELRRMLRSRMHASQLMDASRFASDIEAAYRQMWRNWCSRQLSD